MDVLVVGQPGSFNKEEAKGVELKRAIILFLKSYNVSTTIYLNLHNPQASKSEVMKANKSFMVFHCDLSLLTHF